MEKLALDSYVMDVLMPDLVGHDHKPSAFLVYLFLLHQSRRGRHQQVTISLQTIATRTGLSKSSVQSAIRHLKRRGLLDAKTQATATAPVRRIMRPWIK